MRIANLDSFGVVDGVIAAGSTGFSAIFLAHVNDALHKTNAANNTFMFLLLFTVNIKQKTFNNKANEANLRNFVLPYFDVFDHKLKVD